MMIARVEPKSDMPSKLQMTRTIVAQANAIERLTTERNAYLAAMGFLTGSFKKSAQATARRIVRLQDRLSARRWPWRRRAWFRVRLFFRERTEGPPV